VNLFASRYGLVADTLKRILSIWNLKRLRISWPVEHVLPSQQAIFFTDLDRTQICEALAADNCCEGICALLGYYAALSGNISSRLLGATYRSHPEWQRNPRILFFLEF
jgi:hypothetical protein